MTEINTIRGTIRRAKAEGLGINEHQLRRWVKEGALPYNTSGNRVLIAWSVLLAFLESR